MFEQLQDNLLTKFYFTLTQEMENNKNVSKSNIILNFEMHDPGTLQSWYDLKWLTHSAKDT